MIKIFGARAALCGDAITILPLLNVFDKIYGKNQYEFDLCLAPKCKQIAPLFLFDQRINKVVLTQDNDKLSQDEYELLERQYNVVINPFPSHPLGNDWYNHRDMISESILMAGEKYYEVFKSLPKNQQKPRLNRWWDNGEINKKTIAIHCVGGYSQGTHRAPNQEWWKKLTNELINKGYLIYQFGHPNDFYVNYNLGSNTMFRYNDFSLFEQIQIAAKCEYYIGGDSGFSWILNSFAGKCISLMTRWENNHIQNDLALAPENWNSANINLFDENINNISIDKVLENIK